jgi:hypothetical protein
MANRDILKEAIADAKSIKEAAIANAKVALEEAFTPYLKEKLSAKLAEIDAMDEEMDEAKEMDEMKKSEMDEMKDMDESKDEMYEDENMDEMKDMDEMKKSMDEMDLDELLRELEDMDEYMDEEMDETMDEVINDPKGPGAHGNIAPTAQSDTDLNEAKEGEEEESEEDVEIDIENMSEEDLKSFIESVIADMVKAGELEAGHEGMEDEEESEEEEEVSIDELMHDMDEAKKDMDEAKMKEMDEMKKDLDEAFRTIEAIKSELNEVNLLNSKLLYLNKVFKAKNLTESQKVKVLAAFDKATSKKEAQLVYETVMESLNNTNTTKRPVTESVRGMASKVISGTANSTKQPIIEVNAAFERMQRLAGIKKSN